MKLGYTIIYVSNVAASVLFYERAFGLTPRFVHESGQYAEMETGATALAFVDDRLVGESVSDYAPNRLEGRAAGCEIGLVSDDVPAAFRRALAAGATAVMEPKEKPWGQIVSYVRDNNGFLVEICSQVG